MEMIGVHAELKHSNSTARNENQCWSALRFDKNKNQTLQRKKEKKTEKVLDLDNLPTACGVYTCPQTV